jgi:cytochrome oxidase Cu insertion factor (SCO1/SenC/PrrC family)
MTGAGGRWRTLAAVGLAVLLAGVTPTSAQRTAPLGVGALAPDFTLADQRGTPFTLAEAVRTRDFVVLAFYVKAFTGG